ncbi:PH domain-containing protein [Nonomuraea sp. NPDC059194]|uniref:PH domain-containing protein n=1 Tax=Nonomuraea sp. NPDC059194 TaxID=3346764 RepID=UPI0036C1F70C
MKQTYRSTTAFVLGWIWVAFVVFNAVDLTLRYSGKPSLVAAAVLGVLTALVYVTALRPATVVEGEGLRVRNPLRTTFLPWSAIDDVQVSHTINITHDDKVLRAWTPQASARERARANRRGAPREQRGRYRTEPVLSKGEQAAQEAMAGKTHADWVAEQIAERAESARRRDESPGQVRAVWAPDALAACVAALVLIAVAILL